MHLNLLLVPSETVLVFTFKLSLSEKKDVL